MMIKRVLTIGISLCLFMSISACAWQDGSYASREESPIISPELSAASQSSEHLTQSENEPNIDNATNSDTHQDTTTIAQVFERDGFTLDRIANIQLSMNPDGSSVLVTTPEDIQAVWDTLSKLRITSEGADQVRINDEKAIEVDIQFATPNHATHVVWYGPIVIHGREFYTFAEGFSEQSLYDLIRELIDPKPLSPNYQGLTQEQWQRLQDQKVMYDNLTEEEKETLFDGYIVGHGEIDCLNFIHLYWEDRIAGALIDYVGGNEFNTWTLERARTGQCADIYSLAEHFSITQDQLLLLLTEQNNVAYLYDLDTVKRRYEYFSGSLQEEAIVELDTE